MWVANVGVRIPHDIDGFCDRNFIKIPQNRKICNEKICFIYTGTGKMGE